jgi:uncharacterized protein YbcI
MRVGSASGSTSEDGQRRAAIANEIVAVYRRRYGKGPERARAHIAGDLVVCELRQSLLTLEQTLVELGRLDQVLELRATFHEMLRAEFVDVVERATGCAVRSFMSAFDPDEDLAALVFILGRSRSAAD